MNEKAPPPEKENSHERSLEWAKRVALVMAGVALSAYNVNGIANVVSEVTDPHDGPTTSVVDPAITTARDPERAAKLMEIKQQFIEQCRKSNFVVVILSGTGMETSHYTANQIQDLVNKHGGCVMYHWYGSSLHEDESAESIEKAVEDVTPEGQVKLVMFIGESFGGIAAEDISMDPAITNSKHMKVINITMIETPVDLGDVSETLFGLPLSWFKNLPIPEFNNLTMLLNALNGQRQRNELGDLQAYKDTAINTAKTWPELARDELVRIQQGLRKVNPTASLNYIRSADSSNTVNHQQAFNRIMVITMGKAKETVIHGADHDDIWVASKTQLYINALDEILSSVFGKEA